MENEVKDEQPEKDHKTSLDISKITGLGQKIIGEIEEFAGVVNADPLAQEEGEFNVEVGTVREEVRGKRVLMMKTQTDDACYERPKSFVLPPPASRVCNRRSSGNFLSERCWFIINFGLGEPDLPTPDFLREEAARVSVGEHNGYTSHPGLPALRQLIADQYPHLIRGDRRGRYMRLARGDDRRSYVDG